MRASVQPACRRRASPPPFNRAGLRAGAPICAPFRPSLAPHCRGFTDLIRRAAAPRVRDGGGQGGTGAARGDGRILIALGFAAMAALFALYGRYQSPELVTPGAVDGLLRIAAGFYVAMAASLAAVAYGLYLLHRRLAAGVEAGPDPAGAVGIAGLARAIAAATWNQRSRRIFAATFVSYGAFFSLASGALVYQPSLSFSYHYGVDVPSAEISPCCDAPGYMPRILVYLTDNTGLQIVPLNAVLQAAVSYLVGLNAAVAASAYSLSRKSRGAGGIGAAAGLFVGCPTCVGTFLSAFLGTAGGIALGAALVQLQTLLIAVTIPVLLATPFLLARRLRGAGAGLCAAR